jgi:hypothetical protein
MLPLFLSFRLIERLSSPDRRAVGFLEGHGQLNAAQEFEELHSKDKDSLRSRMDRWCDGNLGPKAWFHNFDETEYRECMVFKLNDNRFYGFKCHPLPTSSPAFLLCVLNIHAHKREWETDNAELDRVNEWHASPVARVAIAKTYTEYGRGKCKPSQSSVRRN